MCAQVSKGSLQQRNSNAMEVKVAIVGLTRSSASFGAALIDFSDQPNAKVIFTVRGHDAESEKMVIAQKVEAIHSYDKSMGATVRNADIVIVDVPMSQQAVTFELLGKDLKSGAVVLDFAPLKTPGVELANEFFPKNGDGSLQAYVVGTTPLVRYENLYSGSEDLEDTNPELFAKNDILIVPGAKAPSDAVKVVNDLADFLGLSPRFMDPAEHDALTGLTETVPTLLSALFFNAIKESQGNRDLLRVANLRFASALKNLHDVEPANISELWLSNRDNMLHHIEQLVQSLETIREVMLENDDAVVESFVDEVLDGFTEWEIRRRDQRWDEDLQDSANLAASGFGGVMSGFFNLRRTKKDDD